MTLIKEDIADAYNLVPIRLITMCCAEDCYFL
jgi:hypothetical protein